MVERKRRAMRLVVATLERPMREMNLETCHFQFSTPVEQVLVLASVVSWLSSMDLQRSPWLLPQNNHVGAVTGSAGHHF